MLIGMIVVCIWAMLAISFIGDAGITLYAIPYHLLKFAHECWDTQSTIWRVISVPIFIVGWVLHIGVRILWYGIFAVIGGGFIYFVAIIGWEILKSFFTSAE